MSSGFDPVPSDRLEVTKETGAALTDFDYRVAASLLKLTHSLRLPKDTISYLADRLALEGLMIPISQVIGFTQYNAEYATVTTQEGTTSAAYTDLATVGPTISGLPAGQYIVIFGAATSLSVAGTLGVAPSYNADAPPTARELISQVVGTFTPATKAITAQLTLASNTVQLKYATTAGTATFIHRWILAFKYGEI